MNKTHPDEPRDPPFGHLPLKEDLKLNAWLAAVMLCYLGMLLLVKRHPEWSPLARALLMLTPLLPGILYIRSWMRFVRSRDELQRVIQLEALLFGSLGTVIVGLIVATLNASGVAMGELRHGLGFGGAFLSMFVLWLVGGAVATRRYQ
jgi:hypothetical protein